MKNYGFLMEVVVTIIAASALGFFAYFIAFVTLPMLNMDNGEVNLEANILGAMVFGLAVGYRLNDLVKLRKKRKF